MATAPPRPDAALLERLRERDRSAWDEVYRLYEGRLYGFAYRLTGNPHDAADLVQETFVRALPKLDRLPPERADIGAYLFATAKNLFLKGVERGKRQQPVEEVPEPDQPTAIEDDPQRAPLLRLQQEEVRLANAKLAPRQRMVLALRELEDRSYGEIGELVGLNENAVAQLISRARQSLREELRLVQVDRSKLPKECQSYLPLLSAHLDGQLRGAKLERTLEHLHSCDDCQRALGDMREASRRYRAVVPPIIGVAAFKDQIDDALGATGYWDRPAGGWSLGARLAARSKLAIVATAAGVVALGGLGGGLAYVATGGSNDDTRSAVASPAATPPGGTRPAASASEAAAVTTVGPETTADPEPDATTEPEPDATTDDATSEPETETQPATDGETETTPETETQPTTDETEPETTADRKAPTVALVSGPNDPTTSRSATFRARASEGNVRFRCRLDSGPLDGCANPTRFTGLDLGRHSFSVQAVDAAGNVGPIVSYGWTVERAATPEPETTEPGTTAPQPPPPDTTAPNVSIGSGPPATTTETSATFSFSANEKATFRCRLDGGGLSPCQSPQSYSGLAAGNHSFTVEATDDAGNRSVASHSWRITPPPVPDLIVSDLGATSVTVANVGDAAAGPFVVSVPGIGTFTISGLAPGGSATRSWSTCAEGQISATVDASSQVAESNEGNNSRSTTSIC